MIDKSRRSYVLDCLGFGTFPEKITKSCGARLESFSRRVDNVWRAAKRSGLRLFLFSQEMSLFLWRMGGRHGGNRGGGGGGDDVGMIPGAERKREEKRRGAT